jgi:hypothetical protein
MADTATTADMAASTAATTEAAFARRQCR